VETFRTIETVYNWCPVDRELSTLILQFFFAFPSFVQILEKFYLCQKKLPKKKIKKKTQYQKKKEKITKKYN